MTALYAFDPLSGVGVEYDCADLAFLPLCICAIRLVHIVDCVKLNLSLFVIRNTIGGKGVVRFPKSDWLFASCGVVSQL